MTKSDVLTKVLHSKIDNLSDFLEKFSSSEIYIAEYSANGTSYILKNADWNTKTGAIEVRRGRGKTPELVTFSKDKIFTIYNSSEIGFIPTDGRGLLKSRCCDFVFFNDTNFCLVELKLNATSTNDLTIRNNRVKAIEQLKSTLRYFDKILSKDYSGLELEAFVATPDTYPQRDTAFQSLSVSFLEATGVKLFESREKRY
ncbi:MAG: hypothetical protein LBH84_08550 [Prevotellaceae bacterium]|jgi:hypothetical protein|nr:hypothetical protein [Prevotellaceae bacterium]